MEDPMHMTLESLVGPVAETEWVVFRRDFETCRRLLRDLNVDNKVDALTKERFMHIFSHRGNVLRSNDAVQPELRAIMDAVYATVKVMYVREYGREQMDAVTARVHRSGEQHPPLCGYFSDDEDNE
jgi:hypothetical protein